VATLHDDAAIWNASLGAPREFQVMDAAGHIDSIVMNSGDVVLLGPKTNQTFKHSLVRERDQRLLPRSADGNVGTRISVCFRGSKKLLSDVQLEREIEKKEDEHVRYLGHKTNTKMRNVTCAVAHASKANGDADTATAAARHAMHATDATDGGNEAERAAGAVMQAYSAILAAQKADKAQEKAVVTWQAAFVNEQTTQERFAAERVAKRNLAALASELAMPAPSRKRKRRRKNDVAAPAIAPSSSNDGQ
jgi:hypothetical protein